VDVTLVNGLLHGYEIKSDRDSLRRLSRQVDFYGKVLDRATLVAGLRHLDSASRLVPRWWEIKSAQQTPKGIVIKQRRRGRKNPSRDPRSLVELIWLEDALQLLHAKNSLRGYKGKPRRIVWDRLCELYELDEIAMAVRERLKARAIEGSLQPRA